MGRRTGKQRDSYQGRRVERVAVVNPESPRPMFHKLAEDNWSKCGMKPIDGKTVILRREVAEKFARGCSNCYRELRREY